ncbi:MAG TPA: type ISP restriction/modification enzyme [Longimicrobiales bacterium]
MDRTTSSGYIDSELFVDERGAADKLFFEGNVAIAVSGAGSSKSFQVLASNQAFGVDYLEKTQALPLRLNVGGNVNDNITDWALKQFRDHYRPGKGKHAQAVTKPAIFHYVYAVLHDPVYRDKYAQNLKREFPRIPRYGQTETDFLRWAGWGEQLIAMHIGYETIEPWPLIRIDIDDEVARAASQSPKPLLKADKPGSRILLDSETTLSGIPPEAWGYKLGNRSALEWILDQYKERIPRDVTIRERFNTYRFADYKEDVIDLLLRVTRVSVQTQKIMEAMGSTLHRS